VTATIYFAVRMLLTIRDLSDQLQIKASTLYAWASQGKIPSRKIHGLLRFDREEIQQWLVSFSKAPLPAPPSLLPGGTGNLDIDRLIARVKRDVYTPRHGETRPRSGLIRKEE
jgi:excisionase family DNA binding protein